MNPRTRHRFDEQLEWVLARMPPLIHELIERVPLHVEDYPSDEVMDQMGVEYIDDLCGLYTGIADRREERQPFRQRCPTWSRSTAKGSSRPRPTGRAASPPSGSAKRSASRSSTKWGITTGSTKNNWRNWDMVDRIPETDPRVFQISPPDNIGVATTTIEAGEPLRIGGRR